jgi:hypothetical protein
MQIPPVFFSKTIGIATYAGGFMAQRRVSFIVRVIVDDANELLRGAIYQVPSEQPIHFLNWADCSQLLSAAVRAGVPAAGNDQSELGNANQEKDY